MVYTYKDILNKYKDDYNIKKALNNKEIYKLEKGIYSDGELVNPLLIYSEKYPNSVISMDNAFYYYDLTDVIPQKVFLATSSKSHKIKDDKVIQIFMNKTILDIRKELVSINNESQKIWMYDRKRMLIELVRKRNKIPFDYYKEIILNYREIANELDMYKIEEYLNYFKNDKRIFDIIQRELF